MELTTEMLARFVGGQVEIQNPGEGYIYRGEVLTIGVVNDDLTVTFSWLAKGEGYPPLSTSWVKDDRLDYAAGLSIYAVSNIGPSGEDVGGGDRICLRSQIVGETVILYPPDGSKLDPADVKGLQVA